MNALDLYDAFQTVDDDILQRSQKKVRNSIALKRIIATASCFLLILGMAVTAEATNGTVSNLLAPLFGGAQTEIVDEIGVPVGASASVNGYTLTLDAIIGDRYSVMMAYTLSRDDGHPVPENIDFDSEEFWASGYRTAIEIDEENPSIAHFHERSHRNEPIIGRIVTESFTDLVIDNGEEETVVAEGTWEIKYTLRYPDSTEKLPVKAFEVTDESGQRYKVKSIMLSPLGIHLDMVLFEPDYTKVMYKNFKISLITADGTEIDLEGGGGGGWRAGAKKANVSYYAEFDAPIPREDIKAIVICGTTYEIH